MEISGRSIVIVVLCISLVGILILPTDSITSFIGGLDKNTGYSSSLKDVNKELPNDFNGSVGNAERFVIIENLDREGGPAIYDFKKTDDGNILFTNSVHPETVTHNNKVLAVALCFDGGQIHVCARYSTDFGETWSDVIIIRGVSNLYHDLVLSNQSDLSLCRIYEDHAIAIFNSDDNPYRIYLLDFSDMTEPSTWDLYWIDMSNIEAKFCRYSVKGLNDLDIDADDYNRVVIAAVGDIVNESSNYLIEGVPVMILSEDRGETFNLIFPENFPYKGMVLRKTSVSLDEDIYVCYEIEGAGILCVYFDDIYHDGWKDFVMENTDTTSYANPYVYAWGENAIIVLESITDGNSDIAFFFTEDSGKHWMPGTAAPACSEDDEGMPVISIWGDNFVLAFERGGNLYMIESCDLETWSELVRVNIEYGTLYPYYGFSDLGDEYGLIYGNIEIDHPVVIYSSYPHHKSEGPEEQRGYLDLSIEEDSINLGSSSNLFFKKTNNKIFFDIENKGTESVEDFVVGVYLKRSNDEIEPLAFQEIYGLDSGERRKVDVSMFNLSLKDMIRMMISFVGVKSIVVRVDPFDEYKEKNESNNELEVKVNYSSIFPKFTWVENFVKNLIEGKQSEKTEELITKVLQEYLPK